MKVFNKIDLLEKSGQAPFLAQANDTDELQALSSTEDDSIPPEQALGISAKTGDGLDTLRQKLLEIAGWNPSAESPWLARERHLSALNNAGDFVDRCAEQADTVILDLSGQRNDPFLPAAFEADHIILPIVPDLQGLCWYLSVRPLLQSVGALERVLPVAALQQPCHYIDGVEKAGEFRFVSAFPWIREIAERRDDGLPAINNRKYARELLPLLDKLKGSAADA